MTGRSITPLLRSGNLADSIQRAAPTSFLAASAMCLLKKLKDMAL